MIAICFLPAVLAGTSVAAIAAASSPVSAEPSLLGSMFQVVLALGLVLVLIVFAAWLTKRFSLLPRPAGGMLRVVSGVMIGQRERVVVVEVQEQWLVLGVTPQSVNLLSSMPKPAESAVTEPAVAPFAERLARAVQRRIRPDSSSDEQP